MEITDKHFKVWVKANASKNEILGFDKDKGAYKIAIKAPAQDNKANIEIIKFLSKKFGKRVKICSGLTSKLKIVKVDD